MRLRGLEVNVVAFTQFVVIAANVYPNRAALHIDKFLSLVRIDAPAFAVRFNVLDNRFHAVVVDRRKQLAANIVNQHDNALILFLKRMRRRILLKHITKVNIQRRSQLLQGGKRWIRLIPFDLTDKSNRQAGHHRDLLERQSTLLSKLL